MKHLIFIFLFLPFLALPQEQITDLSRNATYKTDFRVIGEIDNSVYVLQPNNGIFKVNPEDSIASQIVKFPYGKLYNALISHNRLIFFNDGYNQDSSRVYEVDLDTDSYKLIYGEADVFRIQSSPYALYLTFSTEIEKINFEEFPYKVEKTEMRYIDGEINSYGLFSYRDSLGINQTRFMDKEGNEYAVDNINYTQSKYEEFSNYVVVSIYPYVGNFHIFDKRSKSLSKLPDYLNKNDVRMQFFEEEEKLFILSSSKKYTSNGEATPVTYGVHSFRDGVVQMLFETTELNTNHIYAVPQHMVSYSLYYGYSNPIMKDNVLYFWANDSDKSSEAGQLKLYSINLKTKQISGKSIKDQNVSERLKLTKAPYSLQLSVHDERIVTHVLQSNYFSFDYNTNTQNFAFTEKPYHKAIYPLKDGKVLNFSFKDRLIVQNLETHEFRELKTLQNQMHVSDYDIYRKEKVILIDEVNSTFHYFDGENLSVLNHDLSNDFKSVFRWKCINAEGSDYALIWAGGLKHDDTFEGSFYTINHTLRKIKKVYSYKHNQYFFDDMHYSFSGNTIMIKFNNEMAALVDVREEKLTLYQKEVPMDGVELLHRFNESKFLISDYDRIYLFDAENNSKKIVGSNQLLFNRFVIHNLIYLQTGNRLYTINENGVTNDIITNIISTGYNYTLFSPDEIVYTSTNLVSKINKKTGEISKVKTPVGNPFFTTYTKAGHNYYGFSENGVYNLEFEKETITKIDNINLLNTGAVYTDEASAYFYGETNGKKRAIIKLTGNKFLTFGDFKSDYISGDFSQPLVFTDGENRYFWLPEAQLLKKLDSQKLGDIVSASFFSQTADTLQMISGYNDKFRLLRVNKAGDILENKLLKSNPYRNPVSSKIGSSLYTFINNEGMWKTDSTAFVKINNLETSNAFSKQTFFAFRGNLYVWAKDNNGIAQIFRITDNPNSTIEDDEPQDDESPDILLSTENPNINFSFYPNPTQDYLNVSSTSETENKCRITVFSTDGKVISEQHLELPQKLDLSNLKEGTYLLNVRAGRENKTFRVVKN